MSTINEVYAKWFASDDPNRLMPQVLCADGFKMSVQASDGHYCDPRITYRKGMQPFYSAFEVGFPSRREPLLAEYAEDKKRLTRTVYGWVPASVIDAVIKKHGGLK